VNSRDIAGRLALAREYATAGENKKAVRTLEEALGITLYARQIHQAILPLYRAVGERKKAVRAARCVVALPAEEDTDEAKANMYCDLAEVLLEDGRKEEASAALQTVRKLVEDGHVAAEDLPRLAEIEKRLGQ
jgi:lipopolysaccharide biosynthesis regulator YciM